MKLLFVASLLFCVPCCFAQHTEVTVEDNQTITSNKAFTGNNTHSGTETFNGPMTLTGGIKGPEPWASAVANGATCNGVADDSTSLNATFASVGATGNEMRIEDNCNWATPSISQPAFTTQIHLRGNLKIGSTLNLPVFTFLDGSFSQHNQNNSFAYLPQSTINLSGTCGSFSPIISIAATQGLLGVRNVALNSNCGAGAGTGIQVVAPNVWVENVNVSMDGSTAGAPFISKGGFGLQLRNSQFRAGSTSTVASVQLLDNPTNNDSIRYMELRNGFSAYQGILWGGPSGTYGAPSSALTVDHWLCENLTGSGNSGCVNIDTTNNLKVGLKLDSIYSADSSGPLLYTGTHNCANCFHTVNIFDPFGQTVKGTQTIANLFAQVATHIGSFFPSGSPSWTGLVLSDGNTWVSNLVLATQYNGTTITNTNPAVSLIPNDTTTGTDQVRLAKVTSAGQVKVLATTDTNAAAVGPINANNGTSGNAYVDVAGMFTCLGDNAGATLGSIVTISSTAGGDGQGGLCHDTESTTWPTSGRVIGVIQANTSGSYTIAPIAGQPGAAQTNVASTWTATQTLPSPVINGTPSGTGIQSVFDLVGGGASNYTGVNTTYVAVDTTNLCTAITVPTGWKLLVTASGVMESNTAAVAVSVTLVDAGTTCGAGGVTALAGTERTFTPPAAGVFDEGFTTQWVVTGNGAAHAVTLAAKTSNAADSWGIANASPAGAPSITYFLTPSN